jgi:hypothetical protein
MNESPLHLLLPITNQQSNQTVFFLTVRQSFLDFKNILESFGRNCPYLIPDPFFLIAHSSSIPVNFAFDIILKKNLIE